MDWFLKVLRQYADFSGRARRSEYWMFVLFTFIFSLGAILLDLILSLILRHPTYFSIFYMYSAAMMIPSMAVGFRRLHDLGKSGWWVLINLIPLGGPIWFIVLMATEGQRQENPYGPDPKASTTYEYPENRRLKSAGLTLLISGCIWLLLLFWMDIIFAITGKYEITLKDTLLRNLWGLAGPMGFMAAGIAMILRPARLVSAGVIFMLTGIGLLIKDIAAIYANLNPEIEVQIPMLGVIMQGISIVPALGLVWLGLSLLLKRQFLNGAVMLLLVGAGLWIICQVYWAMIASANPQELYWLAAHWYGILPCVAAAVLGFSFCTKKPSIQA